MGEREREGKTLHPDREPRPPAVERALRFIRDPGSDRFEEVAREVFRHQFESCVPYRRFCERRGWSPAGVRRWQEIPPVPTAAFREVELTTAPARHRFLTSGTSRSGRRGCHALPALDLYRASWPGPFRDHLVPDRDRMPVISLVPSRRTLPGSSLSYMAEGVARRFGEEVTWALEDDGLDVPTLVTAFEDAERTGKPVLILTTSLAAADLLDRLGAAGRRFRLPPGSRIMDTGGTKGHRRAASREALIDGYRDRLGIDPGSVVGEYGMTELCSQFYERSPEGGPAGRDPARRVFRGPPWVRTRVLDPRTLDPAADGEAGFLAHLDLANAWTVSAILTEDLGVRAGSGFRLLGRASGAALRGCSLAAEEILEP